MVTTAGGEADAVVRAFQAGDSSALASLYARWAPLVYTVALRSLGDVTDAELTCARVFSEAWVSRQTFEQTGKPVSRWLLDITRRKVAEAQSDHTSRRPAAASTAAVAVLDNTDQLAERIVFVDALTHLDPESRQAIQLALTDNLTHAQIAERMGLTLETVRHHLRQGLLGLRKSLEVQTDAY